MNTDTIIQLLKNSGFHGLRADSGYIYMENPSCILRSFETFVDYAWIALIAITGFLLTGWAISMIRGIKNEITTNLRNLLIIFFALSLVKPILNVIYGGDVFAAGCDTVRISIAETNRMLEARNDSLGEDEVYEVLTIYDSAENYYQAPIHTQSFLDAPLSGAGNP